MKTKTLFCALALGSCILPPAVSAAPVIAAEFDGTGLDYAFGSWSGSVSVGPSALTIGTFATERGGGGVLLSGPRDMTGLGMALTAQLLAGNAASDILVHLFDAADNQAVFDFATSAFTTTAFTTVSLSAPTFTVGAADIAHIVRMEFGGDFSTNDSMRFSVDRVASYDPTPTGTVPEPTMPMLVAAGLFALTLSKSWHRAR